jgi:hypothetical protein
MLSKVNQSNKFMGTEIIKNYLGEYELIQDNLINILLIKKKNNLLNSYDYLIYDYNKKKTYKYNRISLYFNNNIIYKQIESFDQNNIIIANKIRKYVLLESKMILDKNTILGIGGEYYLYFKFLFAKKYFGISNHNYIIEDAKYNIPNSENYLINYENYNTFPDLDKINKIDLVIINVIKIHNNIIKYIKTFKFNNLIIITCNLTNNKLVLLKNNFKIKKIKYFNNFNNLIRIIQI